MKDVQDQGGTKVANLQPNSPRRKHPPAPQFLRVEGSPARTPFSTLQHPEGKLAMSDAPLKPMRGKTADYAGARNGTSR